MISALRSPTNRSRLSLGLLSSVLLLPSPCPLAHLPRNTHRVLRGSHIDSYLRLFHSFYLGIPRLLKGAVDHVVARSVDGRRKRAYGACRSAVVHPSSCNYETRKSETNYTTTCSRPYLTLLSSGSQRSGLGALKEAPGSCIKDHRRGRPLIRRRRRTTTTGFSTTHAHLKGKPDAVERRAN